MMFPIGYYSIENAAKFLSGALNQPVNFEGIVDIAASGRIHFCKRIDESLCKFSIVKEPITLEEFNKINFIKKPAEYDPRTCFKETLRCEGEYGFRGVICIPKERIKHDCEVITFTTIDKILDVERLYHKKNDPRLIERGAWLGKKKINESPWDKPEQGAFIVNFHEVYIPEQDLHDLIVENQAERSLTKNESSASLSNASAIGDAIIEALKAEGYDPLRIPPYINGFRGIKAQIREKLGVDRRAFDRNWQSLLDNELISYISE